MKPKKLTPLEILQKQKNDLRTKSSELTVSIENHAKHLQQHFGPLLRDSMIKTAVSKMPSIIQNFTGNILQKEKKEDVSTSYLRIITQGIVVGIVEIAPFFLKGRKGAIISILLKQIAKWIRN